MATALIKRGGVFHLIGEQTVVLNLEIRSPEVQPIGREEVEDLVHSLRATLETTLGVIGEGTAAEFVERAKVGHREATGD